MDTLMIKQKGFNLIEVLIGLTIGLIGLLAVSQVFVTFNQQRNTATQTMEAQSNGALALYMIERDLSMAGFGLLNLQDCALLQWYWNPPGCSGAGCGLQSPLSTQPVLITAGATAADSDQIEISYAQSSSAAPGAQVTQDQSSSYADSYHLSSTAGFNTGDMVVADVGGSCTMGKMTGRDDAALTLAHDSSNEYNPSAAALPMAGAANGWEPARVGNMLVNLGTYVSKRYLVINDGLQVSSFPGYDANTAVEGILFMKTQYGRDTGGDGIVDVWDVPGAITDVRQVLAVRIGVVARSPLYEKEVVDAPTTLTVLPAITGGAAITWDIPDAHYRYKVYYTVIPLRNIIWGRAT
jgi:type IV pilus assembly protein PilW